MRQDTIECEGRDQRVTSGYEKIEDNEKEKIRQNKIVEKGENKTGYNRMGGSDTIKHDIMQKKRLQRIRIE